jgi:hypothetical protein
LSDNIIKAGIYTIPAEEYHSDPCEEPSLSASVAKILLNKTPLHAMLAHPRLNPNYREDESARFDIGSAAHSLLLEGDGKMVVVDAKDWRTNAAKEERDAARAIGKYPILAYQEHNIREMVKVAKAFISTSELAGIFELGKPEQTLVWREENGIWCRARLDLLSNDYRRIIDYKTTTSANPEEWARKQIIQLGYDIQAQFYTRGTYIVTGVSPEFTFLLQEIEPPYACSLVAFDNTYLNLGNMKIDIAIRLWETCMSGGVWPGYLPTVQYCSAPVWAMREFDENE